MTKLKSLLLSLSISIVVCSSLTAAAHADAPLRTVTGSLPAVATRSTRAAVRRQLAARRRVMIERLHAYARAGAFPINDIQPGMLNIMVDDDGHICAAANLIALD